MIARRSVLTALCGLALGAAASLAAPDPLAPKAEIAPGVYLVRGKLTPGEQPDGNSLVFRATEGAVIFDTGRHVEHTQAILDLVARLKLVPRVVVNSHWHLDHVGGNVLLRQRYPDLKVYASDAIDGALRGFLVSYRGQLAQLVSSAQTSTDARDTYRREMKLIDAGAVLAPTDVVSATGPRTLAGRSLELHLEDHAATAGDVWVRDPAAHLVAAGDLVTLPVPFLDTACPKGWQTALAHLEAADWTVLVPGHGPPLDRAGFATYRKAFDALLACAASKRSTTECVDGWFHDGGTLVSANDPGQGHEMMRYYVEQSLRAPSAATAKLCGS